MPRKSTLKTLVILAASLFSLLTISPVSHAGTTTYFYDELDRVKEMDLPDGNALIYNYDELGNLIGKTSGLSHCQAGYSFNSTDNLCENHRFKYNI